MSTQGDSRESASESPFWIMWRVSCVNRQTRELFERDLFLDITTAPTEDRRRIKHILDSDNHRAMLKYRHLFREQALPEGERDQKAMARGRFSAVSLSSYYEDEAGNPLDELRFMQALAGHEDIIIPGNPASVMRLGPTDIARPEKWTLRKANDVAHFLEVTNCLALSDWVRSKTSFSYTGDAMGKGEILSFERPNVLILNSVLIFARQLVSDGDKLFKLATDAYLCHVSDEAKRWYVTERRRRFNDVLNKPMIIFDISGKSGQEIVGLFFYGFGLVHRDDSEQAKEFRQVIEQHGKERVMMAFHGTLQHLYAHAHNVAHVIGQDFRHWINNKQCDPPDRVSIADVLGDITRG